MPMSKCKDVIDRISAIIDGEADIGERMRFHMHLMMCRNCRTYYKQFKTVKVAAGQVSPEDLAEDFDQIMDFVLRETTQNSSK